MEGVDGEECALGALFTVHIFQQQAVVPDGKPFGWRGIAFFMREVLILYDLGPFFFLESVWSLLWVRANQE